MNTLLRWVAAGWLFSVGLPGVIHAQAPTLRFEHLTEKQGLSDNRVYCILQDREGFMWFGTAYGLNRYDGNNFTVFKHDPNNPAHTMQGASISFVHEDQKGNLWVANQGGGGLNKVDKRTGTVKPFPNPDATIFTSLHVDRQGLFWFGTRKGLVLFNPNTEKFIHYTNPDAAALAVAEDPSGRIWTFGTGIFHFDRHTGKYTRLPQHLYADSTVTADYYFTAAHLDKQGILWIGTRSKAVVTVDTKANPLQLIPYNPGGLINQTINTIYEEADGFLWLATTEGLQRIDKKTNTVTTYHSDPALPGTLSSNSVQRVYKDRQGTLWVGTNNGIHKAVAHQKPFHPHQVKITASPVLLPENSISTIVDDRMGMVWLGNGQTGLYQFNPHSGQFTHIKANPADPGSLSSEGVGALYEDRLGRLWVSTREALHRRDPVTGKFIRYPTKFPVIALDEDSSGKLWTAGTTGTLKGAIAYLDSATRQFRYYYRADDDTGLNGTQLYSLMASRIGDIWVATGLGLNRLNPKTGKFTYYTPDDPFTAGHLNDRFAGPLYEDAQGIIWVGTEKSGLNRFDPRTNTFTYFTSREGLPGNQITSVMGDGKGHLWLGTSQGLSRFNPRTKTFRNYDISDGLPSNRFLRSAYQRNGRLLFGTINGFVRFHPDSIRDNTTPPPVYLTGLKVLEKSRPLPQDRLDLSYDENFLSFEFVALNYDAPEKNQYAYRLVGLDKGWIYSGTRRYAGYPGLPPGDYTFRVKASNNDGIWNEKGATLRVIIHPPWWRTWWAYGFYGLCLLAGLFAFDRYQRRRLVNRERERTKERELAQAREIERAYHELKATQAQLIQKEKMASLGELTAGIAHEIQNPLNFVNNYSEVNVELLEELEEELKKGDLDQAQALLTDLQDNESKIHHHGRRADAIVRGMLEHARTTPGEKAPTDLNRLADEYLRLAYQGMRRFGDPVKASDFQCELITDFDPNLGEIEVVAPDIGRVLLNLYNNAFYAVQQKRVLADQAYTPTVWVSTQRLDQVVEIRVRDNGPGITPEVVDKIFQPFFTTKPTGQGTGLGLSLSYDIVKAHGGELKVETKEGEGSEFIIQFSV